MNADLLVKSTLQSIQAVRNTPLANLLFHKATDVSTAIEAYERISDLTSYPLHRVQAGRDERDRKVYVGTVPCF